MPSLECTRFHTGNHKYMCMVIGKQFDVMTLQAGMCRSHDVSLFGELQMFDQLLLDLRGPGDAPCLPEMYQEGVISAGIFCHHLFSCIPFVSTSDGQCEIA